MHSRTPTVTFVVPCYKLAHFLRECVDSILAQEYSDLEVLIMDDCSPDETPAVARTFRDPRVRYVRNRVNLGHLRNYNSGIGLARGRYLWLISADDRLRSRSALGKLVALLDATPEMSFAFSPGLVLRSDGLEGETRGDCGPVTRVFSGAEFFGRMIPGNDVCTPGALSRTASYHQVGLFPTDLPYAGEWYLWLRFSLLGPVGYVPEAGVHYRQHDASHTAIYAARNAGIIIGDEIAVRWRIRRDAVAAGIAELRRACDEAIAWDYARRTFRAATEAWPFGLDPDGVLNSVREHSPDSVVFRTTCSRYYELVGDLYEDSGDCASARTWYARSLESGAWRAAPAAKLVLARLGSHGAAVRRGGAAFKSVIGRFVSSRARAATRPASL